MEEKQSIVNSPKPPNVFIKPVLPASVTRKHFWYWSLVVLAAVAAVTLVLVQALKPEQDQVSVKNKKPVISNQVPAGFRYMAFLDNQYPPDFPKDVMIITDAKIIRTSDTTDEIKTEHKVVEFTTASSPKTVAEQYKGKMPALKWSLTYDYAQGGASMLNFSKDTTVLSVIAVPLSATTTQVNLDAKRKK